MSLVAPQYARAYVKTDKNDAACRGDLRSSVTADDAVRRSKIARPASDENVAPRLRSLDQAAHDAGERLRGHLAEFGVTAGHGTGNVKSLLIKFNDTRDRLPKRAAEVIDALTRRLSDLQGEIQVLDKQMLSWHRSNEASSRLAEIPGVGPVIATAIVATVGNASQFASARHFAAWLGLVPRGSGTGGKIRFGSITKRADGYLRRLMIQGARSVSVGSAAVQAPHPLG